MFAFISKELVQTSAKHHHLFYDNRSIAAVIGFLQAPGARRPRSSVQNSCPVSTGRRCAFSPSTRPNQACSTAMGRYPWAEVLLFHVIHITSYYPTHQRAYRVVALSAMIYVARQIYLTPEIAGPKVAYPMGCALACNFVFSVYLLSAEGPFPDYWRRVRDEVDTEVDAGGLDKLPSNFPLAKKLWWMVDIAYGVRMIGWVQEPRDCIPRHPPPSRRMFLWKTFLKLVMNIVTADLMNSALALSPAFDYRVHDPTDGPETYLAAVPLLRRVPYVLAWSIGTGASAGAIHNVVALVCVGLGYSSPTLWPDLWGRWRDAYTVRNLWGYVHWWSFTPSSITESVLGKRGTKSCDRYEHFSYYYFVMDYSEGFVLVRWSGDWEGSLQTSF